MKDHELSEMRDVLPILPSRTKTLYPGRSLPIKVRKRISRKAVDAAKNYASQVVVLAQKNSEASIKASNLYHIGTLADVVPGRGKSDYTLHGVKRIQVLNIKEEAGILFAQYETLPDQDKPSQDDEIFIYQQIQQLGNEILSLIPADTSDFKKLLDNSIDLEELIYLFAENLDGHLTAKQALLEECSLIKRSLMLLEKMQEAKESLVLQAEVRERLSDKMTKAQREGILREHMKAIQEELGEGDDSDKLRKKLNSLELPKDVYQQATEELSRMEAMGKISPEAHVIRNYLELIVQLPWEQPPAQDIKLEAARSILESQHFGLDNVKKRVIEYIATMKLRKSHAGTILLLLGPPGVGKTSLGKSIAEALDRPFVRASLGGIRDDSEIRGHRRTYIGAMPGKIIQGIKRAKQRNPVFLLDEIDKLGRGIAGDPASALLEVLDPEQNNKFVDHFLDLPYDLSDVLFIGTANSLEGLPLALRDRMEVIELSSYTSSEKSFIASKHLIPRQIENHGLTTDQCEINKDAIDTLINHYTREAGVRELNRKIAALCRYTATLIVDGTSKLIIDSQKSLEILGKVLYDPTDRADILPPGVATGLAWTPVGGDILFIEARAMPGTGKLVLTGQLGEVMKESATIALSLIRSKMPALVPDFSKQDIHIHVPSGGIPKDGPSAGIALFSALCSLFTQCSLSSTIAMSGEVTLRGVIMPVGGIKEKLLAAHRAGIKSIIICKDNKKDLVEVPEDILQTLNIDFAEDISELLTLIFGQEVTLENAHLTESRQDTSTAAHSQLHS